ncbi:hypothetical protein DRE_00954 [Drechslerella stenobrocha 248]|uniref:FAD dependent oxidoreductase domain-containing protein n=1 Tax=Drechslerella stenobrocha 248 TaxID=1043628 RepID=W7I7E4_9PEZI|nr:hypothetical protein DRE_00954 [Drechslerella stenobrocha 248]
MRYSRFAGPNEASDSPVFAIIGGGIAGSVQAIHLAEKYPWINIHIFEKNKEILSGTSSMNPGRPTFGFHYRHLETATFCQDNTVKFTKFLDSIGCPNIFAKAPQRGIYVLMKDAAQVLDSSVKPVFRPDEIEPIFEKIRDHAIENYSFDEDFKKHFGPADQICRRLEKDEYKHFITPELFEGVGSCYETAEKTFDTAGVCLFLRNYIKRVKNITISTESNVTRVVRIQQPNGSSYQINWTDGTKDCVETAKFLTLACWERVGQFRKQLGKAEHQPTYNRLKMLAIVEMDIPASRLDTIRPIFVASGPFSMISPQKCIEKPNGRIVCRCACTLAVRTNVMTAPDDRPLPAQYDKILQGRISAEAKRKMAMPILEGARQFFACLSDAKLVDVRFGTVRVPFGGGNAVDLHDPASEHHSRDYPGCSNLGEGLFVNEAMKMIYSVYNAEMMVDWLRAELNGNRVLEAKETEKVVQNVYYNRKYVHATE